MQSLGSPRNLASREQGSSFSHCNQEAMLRPRGGEVSLQRGPQWVGDGWETVVLPGLHSACCVVVAPGKT